MVREVGRDGRGLIGRLGEAVAESTAGVDDGLAGFLGCCDTSARDDLRGTYGGDVRAAAGIGISYRNQENLSKIIRHRTYQVPGKDGLKVPEPPLL